MIVDASFTSPRWHNGTPLTISHPLTELKSPQPVAIACSINDWFKDEAQDNEEYDDLKDGPARFAGLMGIILYQDVSSILVEVVLDRHLLDDSTVVGYMY